MAYPSRSRSDAVPWAPGEIPGLQLSREARWRPAGELGAPPADQLEWEAGKAYQHGVDATGRAWREGKASAGLRAICRRRPECDLTGSNVYRGGTFRLQMHPVSHTLAVP